MNPKIFISHSSADRDLATAVISLIQGFFELRDNMIRCTSVQGYKLPAGVGIESVIQSEIDHASVVLGIVTPRSVGSPWVLCELGAAWGKSGSLIPCLATLDFDEVSGPIGNTHCMRLDSIDDVHGIIRELETKFSGEIKRRSIGRSRESTLIDEVVSISNKIRPFVPDYKNDNLYSLHFSSDDLITDTNTFQDFSVGRSVGENVNAVHFMWADTYANGSIQASIEIEDGANFLRIKFNNGIRELEGGNLVKAWSSNIKIKPIKDAAFDNKNEGGRLKYKTLKFSARSSGITKLDGKKSEAALSVRLLDRRLTYWSYAGMPKGGTPTQFRLSNEWATFELLLQGGGYKIFDADGNNTVVLFDKSGRPVPDFSVFAGIVFVVGSYTGGREEPSSGAGEIDLGPIYFE